MDKNQIGTRGENFVASAMLQCDIFRESFLGDKFPVADFLFEIINEANPYPLYIQVKSTEEPDVAKRYTKKTPIRLKTPVPDDKYKSLVKRPIPTYVAGVDYPDRKAYIAPAYSDTEKYPSIPMTFVLDLNPVNPQNKANLERLRDDVINYWTGINPNLMDYKHNFNSTI